MNPTLIMMDLTRKTRVLLQILPHLLQTLQSPSSGRDIRTFRWMLETTVSNGSQQLGLQEEVSETGRVDTHIRTLFVCLFGDGGVVGWSRGLDGNLLRVGVVQ